MVLNLATSTIKKENTRNSFNAHSDDKMQQKERENEHNCLPGDVEAKGQKMSRNRPRMCNREGAKK